jgi:glycosyltransferase involved in cell wall biosynthesis
MSDAEADLRVLQLVTTPRPFFRQQVEELERRGVECTVVSVPRDRDGGRGAREYLSFALRSIGRGFEDFDLVHANYGLIGPAALAQRTRPVVLTLWGSDVMGPAWLRRLSTAVARRSDAVIAPSEPLARHLSTPYHFVPFGVDTDLFRPIDRQRARERVGWDPDERIALFPYDPERPVKNYRLAERVAERAGATLRTVSGADHEEMPYYVNASDALLVTSERESGPMVVKEAAACNVPVVSTPVGFAPDVLEGVANSVVAATESELAARLAAILDDGGRADGRTAIDGLGLDEMGERLLSIYLEIT